MWFGKGKMYDEEDESDSQFDSSEEGYVEICPPPAAITRLDFVIALVLAAVSGLFAFAFSTSLLHPSAWHDCAMAANLRHPSSICPGIWRIFAVAVYNAMGISAAGELISFLGKISLGFIAGVTYLSFKALLALLVRKLPPTGLWNMGLSRILSAVTAFAFVCSDPVWQVCQAFTSQTLLVVMFCVTGLLWVRFLRNGKLRAAYMAMFVTGFFAAETPLGFLLFVVYWFLYGILLRHGFLGQVELNNLFIRQNAKWYLTFCGASGFIAGLTANILAFIRLGGLYANEYSVGDIPVLYLSRFWELVVSAASMSGWIIAFGVAILPVIIVLALVVKATDPERFLMYQIGLVFFLFSCCAYCQLFSLRPLWFWTWIQNPVMVTSPLLLVVFVFLSSVTLLCSMSVLAIDAFCRNNHRLAQQLNPESVITSEPSETNGHKFYRFSVLVFLCILIVAGVIPGRVQPGALKAVKTMHEYVEAVTSQIGDAKWLFSDGAFDCAIELGARVKGKNVACISILPGHSVRNSFECKRTLPDDEDRLAMDVNSATLFRTWVRDKPARLSDSAFQLGFELWSRDGNAYPAVGGVVGRVTGKIDEEELSEYVKEGHRLSGEVLNYYASYGSLDSLHSSVKEPYLCMQWRLARLARTRATIYDLGNRPDDAITETTLSGKLDAHNDSLKRILESMTRIKESTLRQMTPREGLHFAIVRQNFALARHYAEPILTADPDDPDANFATGMSYCNEGHWARAEEYLKRCLVRRKNEPAIWNNIAMMQLKTGKYREAYENAKKALELKPDSAEIKDTVNQIKEAIKKAIQKRDEKEGKAAANEKKESGK